MKAAFEFNGVVRLTRIGAGFLAFTFVVGFAAINTGNNSLYIGLAFLFGTLLASGIASREALHHIELTLVRLDDAWAGRPAWGVVRVANRSRLWTIRDLLITSPELESPILVPIVVRRSSVDIAGRFAFERRGRVRFKKADLYTRYPFGLFTKKRRVSFAGEAVVFPRLFEHTREPRRLGGLQGETPRTDRHGMGTEIYAFREYVRGDSLRLVHWKKSASLGRWIMKQTELEAGRSIVVAVDPVVPAGAPEEEFEQMISEATTMIHHAFEIGVDVVLHLPAARMSGQGRSSRQQMFEALALVEMATSGERMVFDPGTFVFSLRRPHEARTA